MTIDRLLLRSLLPMALVLSVLLSAAPRSEAAGPRAAPDSGGSALRQEEPPTEDPPNTSPETIADFFFSDETGVSFSAADVLANDLEFDGDTLTASLDPYFPLPPALGSVTFDGTAFRYTPPAGFTGPAEFGYIASDGRGGSALGRITVIVRPVNRAPVATVDVFYTRKNDPLSFTTADLLANDFDSDGDPLIATPVSPPSHGDLVGGQTGAFVYTPDPGFVGMDGFVYSISDGRGGVAIAEVYILVG